MKSAYKERPVTVAIVGGGIAGVSLALGILKHASHIQFHIYEAAPRFQEIGLGVAFGINAQRALHKLDPRAGEAYARIATSNVDVDVELPDGTREESKETYLRFVMGMDHRTDAEFKAGREVCEVFCEGGFSSVHRARFLDGMVALLPEDVKSRCVSFGKRVVGVEDLPSEDAISTRNGVRLHFADGTSADVDAAIGCDGIKSQLRRTVLADEPSAAEPVFSGKFAYRGLITMDKAVAALSERLARNGHHHLGYDGHVLHFPIDHGKTMNVVAFRTKVDWIWEDGEWVVPTSKEEMRKDFEGWNDSVHAILSLMERSDKWALFDHQPARTYHKAGRSCLIGDAAHASTPHQGSGAGLAKRLARVRGTKDLEPAFVEFEALRKKRTQKLVRASREQAALYEFQAEGVEDDVGKIARILPRRWDWIWEYELD
jgi:salicylate hydroxylase